MAKSARSQNFAVNLFATGESDIAPVAEEDLTLGGGAVEAETNEQLGLQEFWGILVILALLTFLAGMVCLSSAAAAAHEHDRKSAAASDIQAMSRQAKCFCRVRLSR